MQNLLAAVTLLLARYYAVAETCRCNGLQNKVIQKALLGLRKDPILESKRQDGHNAKNNRQVASCRACALGTLLL